MFYFFYQIDKELFCLSEINCIYSLKLKTIMKKFSTAEILIVIICVICIFLSEYYYLVEKNPMKAIFIGLWPPTILGLINFLNIKKN